MTKLNQLAISVGEPNWIPLELAVPAGELENFMYMGRAGEIELYKHHFTRRYLNIGRNSASSTDTSTESMSRSGEQRRSNMCAAETSSEGQHYVKGY